MEGSEVLGEELETGEAKTERGGKSFARREKRMCKSPLRTVCLLRTVRPIHFEQARI